MARRRNQRTQRSTSRTEEPHLLPLPHATWAVFRSRLNVCRNVGLLFERYLRFQDNWQLGTYRRGQSAKMFNIQEIAKAQERCKQDRDWREMHSQFVHRWKASVRALGAEPLPPMTPEWRLVIGLGDKGALEVGLTFHRIYGFPIVPASALKGLARTAALWEIAETLGIPALPLHEAKVRKKDGAKTTLEKLEDVLLAYDEQVKDEREQSKMREDEKMTLQALEKEVPGIDLEVDSSLISRFRTIFGTLHAAGQAIFFDGVPAEPPTLEPDVMNVHYQEYYQGNKPPADYLNPNPIPFLAVGGKSRFLFAVGWRGVRDEAAHAQAITWFKGGLCDLGIGAKTAAGYGYMEVL